MSQKINLHHLVSGGVAKHIEPSTTAKAVLPAFEVRSPRIRAVIEILSPFAIGGGEFGATDMRRSTVGELCLVARPTIGTRDIQHGLMRHAGGGALVDERAPLEALEVKRTNQGVGRIVDDGLGHGVATCRDRFVAARTPTAVDVEVAHRG